MQLPLQSSVAVTATVEVANPDTSVLCPVTENAGQPPAYDALSLSSASAAASGPSARRTPRPSWASSHCFCPPGGGEAGGEAETRGHVPGASLRGSGLRPSGTRTCVSRTKVLGPPGGCLRSRRAEQEAGNAVSLRRRSGFKSPPGSPGLRPA